MTTVNCPKCDEQVRLPADTSSQARVQCPLCVEEFELAEALGRLAPMLVVVHDPTAFGATGHAADKTFSGTDLVAEAESDAAAPAFSIEATNDEAAPAPAFAFEDGSSSGAGSATAARRARSQRPQKSAVKEMLKIVGGGVIGLSIGQLILWWALVRDPLDFGPKVPAFAAFIVHPDFRAPAIADKDGTAAPTTTGASTNFDNFGGNNQLPSTSFEGLLDPNNKQTNQKKRNKKNGQQPADTKVAPNPPAPGEEGDFDPLAPLPTETEEDIFGAKPELDVPMVNLPFATPPDDTNSGESGEDTIPAIPTPGADPTIKPEVDPPPTGDFVGVRNAPTISVEQLSTRLSGAVSASIAMDTSSTEPVAKQLTLAREFYTTLAGLGEAITFVEPGSATNQVDEVGKFAVEVGKQSAKLELIGKVAPSWIKSSRPHNGLVVHGIVESIEFNEPYYVTSLVMPDKNKSVLKVVSMNDPSGDYQPQTKILVLGSILEAPQQNLENYQGDATTVVLDGLHASLPRNE